MAAICLGGPCRVNLIRITWFACPAALEVQIPSGGGNWLTVRTLRPEPSVQAVLPGELHTDRVRLYFRSAPGERCGIRKVELPGEGETPPLPVPPGM